MHNPNHWQYEGDICPEDHGGKWYRRAAQRVYQVIELTNMTEVCGRDNEGHPTYVVELSLVDLNQIPAATQEDAWKSCGNDYHAQNCGYEIDNTLREAMTVVACYECGAKAPLESWSGNGSARLLSSARKLAAELKQNSDNLARRLNKPVNKIGSTATEYMTGDLHSAILRGVSEGHPEAELMLRLGMGR